MPQIGISQRDFAKLKERNKLYIDDDYRTYVLSDYTNGTFCFYVSNAMRLRDREPFFPGETVKLYNVGAQAELVNFTMEEIELNYTGEAKRIAQQARWMGEAPEFCEFTILSVQQLTPHVAKTLTRENRDEDIVFRGSRLVATITAELHDPSLPRIALFYSPHELISFHVQI